MGRLDTKRYRGILLWLGGANLSGGCGSRNHHPGVFFCFILEIIHIFSHFSCLFFYVLGL